MFELNGNVECKVRLEYSSAVRRIDCLICGTEQQCSQMVDVNLNYFQEKCSDSFCEFLQINNASPHRNECKIIIGQSYYCNKCKSYLKCVYDKYQELEKIQNELQLLRKQCMMDLAVAKLRQLQPQPRETSSTSGSGEAQTESQFQSRQKILQYTNAQEYEVEALDRLNLLSPNSHSDSNDVATNATATETGSTREFSSPELYLVSGGYLQPEEIDINEEVAIKEENDNFGEEVDNEIDNLYSLDVDLETKSSAKGSSSLQASSSGAQDELANCAPSSSSIDTTNDEQVSQSTSSARPTKTKRRSTTQPSVSKRKRPRYSTYKEKIKKLKNVKSLKVKKTNPVAEPKKDVNFSCPIDGCTKIFRKNYTLQDHIKLVHEGKNYLYECNICQKRFLSRTIFKDHGNIHANLTPYSCSSCDVKFSTRLRLKTHKQVTHDESKFQCLHCNDIFPTKKLHRQHVSRKHSNSDVGGVNTYEHICEICGQRFTCIRELKSHINVHNSSGQNDLIKTDSNTEDNQFVCEICGQLCKTKRGLSVHCALHRNASTRQNAETISFQCDTCGKVFKTKGSYRLHVRFHTDPFRFQCELCDYRTHDQGHMIRHREKHNLGQQFQCDLCKGTFKSKTILRQHKKYSVCVQKPKDLICRFCHKGFKSQRSLRTHERRHKTVEPGYLCSDCGKAFRSNHSLRRHVEQQHQEKTCGEASTSVPRRNYPSFRRTPLERFQQSSDAQV